MSRTPDQSFEGALRGMLEERRPGNGAPAELRDRVARIPEEVRPGAAHGSIRPMASIAGSLAGLAAAAAIALLVFGALGSRPVVPDVGSAPAPDAPVATFDPAIDGPGMVPFSDAHYPPQLESLASGPWAVAAIGGVLLALVAITGGRLRRLAALAGVLVLTVGASGLSSHPGFEMGSSVGPRLGLEVRGEATRMSDRPDEWYVIAGPGEPISVAFEVRNPGPLPIRLLGVVQSGPDTGFRRWTAVWLDEDSDGGLPGVQEATLFRPVDVQPDGSVVLYLVGRAGECAFGPDFRPDNDHTTFVPRRDVQIAYAVLGLSSVSEVELPVRLVEPQREECTGS